MGENGEFNAASWLVDRHVAEGRGDRVAIRCQGRSTTYAELQQQLWRAQNLLLGLSLGLVVGGAIGNVIDRGRFGAVVDFLDFYVGSYHWPAFNVADSAITVGVILLILDSLKSGDEKP